MSDILQAAQQVRPGTAWNYDGTNLTQAEDGTPRVSVPTLAELQPILDAQATAEKARGLAIAQARLDVKNQILPIGQRLQALLICLNLDQ